MDLLSTKEIKKRKRKMEKRPFVPYKSIAIHPYTRPESAKTPYLKTYPNLDGWRKMMNLEIP